MKYKFQLSKATLYTKIWKFLQLGFDFYMKIKNFLRQMNFGIKKNYKTKF